MSVFVTMLYIQDPNNSDPMKENVVKMISSPTYQETVDRVDKHIATKISRVLKSVYEKRKSPPSQINE